VDKGFTPTHPEIICQVCGRANAEEADACRFCKAPLYVVSGGDSAEDFFEQVPAYSHLESRLALQEQREKELRGSLLKLAEEMERQGRTLSILQSGFSTLKELLEEKSLIRENDFIERWERVLTDQLFLIEQRDKLLKKKSAVFQAFRGRQFKLFARTVEKAEFYFYTQNRDKGLEALLQALALDPRNLELITFLGSFHLQEENLPQAARYLEKALHIEPTHFEARFYQGLLKALSLDYPEAIKTLESIKDGYGETFLVRYTLGTLYASLRDYPAAERELTAACELEKNPQAAFALASVRYTLGNIPGALHLLEDLKSVREADEETLYLLGMCYLEKDWIKKAQVVFKELVSLKPSRGRYEQALILARGWKAIHPLSGGARRGADMRKADALLEAHQVERAWRAYRRLAKAAAPHPLLRLGYAVLSQQTRRYAEAVLASRALLDRDPPEAVAIPAWVTLLSSLKHLREDASALSEAQRMAARCSSAYARAFAFSAWAYHLAELGKNFADAAELAETAVELASDEIHPLCLDVQGWVLYKQGEYARSVELLRQSARMDSGHQTLVHLGMASLALGLKEESRQAFRSARKRQDEPEGLPLRIWHALKLQLRSKLA